MKKNSILILTIIVLSPSISRADEGMWMVNSISKALVQKMESKGLELSADEIYNVDKVSLKDAIVSLDFGCTGSMISDQGLLITNHHCAYADIHALSSDEHNYLKDGFVARDRSEEIYIPGKSMYFLQKVLDVTDEADSLVKALGLENKMMGMRRLSSIIEKKYSEATGLEASLSSMWSGSRYYLALYRVFTDVRLVAAPPESIAAFGGDIDNWEWPQHKCDFALYRIYAAPDGSPREHCEGNVPYRPACHLKISTQGYKPGDFTMIMGYPGMTDRYCSSAEVRYKQDMLLPISTDVQARQMEIINYWMNRDPEIRLKYADKYFMLSNVQECRYGEMECYKRLGVIRSKQKEEKKMRDRRILALVDSLNAKYDALAEAIHDTEYYRECLVRATAMSRIATKLGVSLKNKDRNGFFSYEKEYAELDMRVEKDLFKMAVKTFYENVDSSMWGPYQKELHARYCKNGVFDAEALGNYLWKDDYMTADDPVFRFMNDNHILNFYTRKKAVEGGRTVAQLCKAYTRAVYKWREEHGVLQYPDANSTMRLTFGEVGTFRRDGKKLPWQTWSYEILAKEDPSKYEFTLKPDWKANLQGSRIPVDFLTDNDITGGNSGSPVLNGRGEIIGLAFDGNKESLAGDSSWTEGFNKCVSTDIRFVLWTIGDYLKMDNIIKEIND